MLALQMVGGACMGQAAVDASVPWEEYGVNHTQTGDNYSW